MELPIYGLGRVGVAMPDIDITNDSPPTTHFTRRLNRKFYELTDHLGNVRAVLGDRKRTATPGAGNYFGEIRSYQHVYPFGMPQPGRVWDSSLSYRYGFNGMETDAEVKRGAGKHYTTYFRQYDPRLGRWFSIDPDARLYVDLSPYNGLGNNPIYFTDFNGDRIRAFPVVAIGKGEYGRIVKSDPNKANYIMAAYVRVVEKMFGGKVRLSSNRSNVNNELQAVEYGVNDLLVENAEGKWVKATPQSLLEIKSHLNDQQAGALDEFVEILSDDDYAEFGVTIDDESIWFAGCADCIFWRENSLDGGRKELQKEFGVIDVSDIAAIYALDNQKNKFAEGNFDFRLNAVATFIHEMREQFLMDVYEQEFALAHLDALRVEGQIGGYEILYFNAKKMKDVELIYSGIFSFLVKENDLLYQYSFEIDRGKIVDIAKEPYSVDDPTPSAILPSEMEPETEGFERIPSGSVEGSE